MRDGKKGDNFVVKDFYFNSPAADIYNQDNNVNQNKALILLIFNLWMIGLKTQKT